MNLDSRPTSQHNKENERRTYTLGFSVTNMFTGMVIVDVS